MSEKLCLFCDNFKCDAGTADTGGYGGEDYMYCTLELGRVYMVDDEKDFRKNMMFANECPKYKQVKP